MKMKKCMESRISCAIDRVELIRKELIDCIRQLVDDEGSVDYQVTLNCGTDSGYDEVRSIERNDGDEKLVILNEEGYILSYVEDLSVDDLESILLKIK